MYCQGHLASIPNEETHNFLKSLGQSLGQRTWVGGYWNGNGWHWSDGTPWQYQSWIPGMGMRSIPVKGLQ